MRKKCISKNVINISVTKFPSHSQNIQLSLPSDLDSLFPRLFFARDKWSWRDNTKIKKKQLFFNPLISIIKSWQTTPVFLYILEMWQLVVTFSVFFLLTVKEKNRILLCTLFYINYIINIYFIQKNIFAHFVNIDFKLRICTLYVHRISISHDGIVKYLLVFINHCQFFNTFKISGIMFRIIFNWIPRDFSEIFSKLYLFCP